MDKIEIGKLLTIAAGFDNRKVDRITVEAWALVPEMGAADFEAAKAAVVAHQTGPNRGEYLTVGHIVAALRIGGRSTLAAVEADVRSAKARGLIEPSWGARTPLPPDAADALFTLREGERRAAAERFAFDQIEGVPVDVGEVGMRA